MRPLGVVKADYPLKDGLAFVTRGDCHLVQPFSLQDSIGALGNGVLKRISALRHTDAYAVLPELRHIRVTAVLAASVRVMDKMTGRIIVYRREGHLQSLQRVYGLQCRTDRPADYLVRVCISYQRQIAHSLFGLHVCDVGHPYLVRAHRNDIRDEVRILPVVVVGVRCAIVPAAAQMHHQTVLAQYLDERITAWHAAVLIEQSLDYQIKFGASEARIVLTVGLGLLDYEGFYRILGKVVVITFVV